jgi:hypothetical protein
MARITLMYWRINLALEIGLSLHPTMTRVSLLLDPCEASARRRAEFGPYVSFHIAVSNNDSSLTVDTLPYHFVYGDFSDPDSPNTLKSSSLPVSTIGRTAMSKHSMVQLEANHSQVIAWATALDMDNNSYPHILNQKYVFSFSPAVFILLNFA